MTKKGTTTPKMNDTNPKSKKPIAKRVPIKKIRGYDALKPFLREVDNIVSQECGKHESMNGFPWYAKWSECNNKQLFTSTSINTIGKIVCPKLNYNERTVKQVA